MGMATVGTMALAEYLQRSWHPDREWVRGELREHTMGDKHHSVVQAFLIWYLRGHEHAWKVEALPELRTRVSAENYRIPDVVLVREESPVELVVQTPPLLCIEVVSPDDRRADMQEKVAEYLAMGVQAVWVIDPRRRTGEWTEGGDLSSVDRLIVSGTEIELAVADIWADLDRRMKRQG